MRALATIVAGRGAFQSRRGCVIFGKFPPRIPDQNVRVQRPTLLRLHPILRGYIGGPFGQGGKERHSERSPKKGNKASHPPVVQHAERRHAASVKEVVFNEIQAPLVRNHMEDAVLLRRHPVCALAAEQVFYHLVLVGDGEGAASHARCQLGAPIIGGQRDLAEGAKRGHSSRARGGRSLQHARAHHALHQSQLSVVADAKELLLLHAPPKFCTAPGSRASSPRSRISTTSRMLGDLRKGARPMIPGWSSAWLCRSFV